jgi:hypothetical protein
MLQAEIVLIRSETKGSCEVPRKGGFMIPFETRISEQFFRREVITVPFPNWTCWFRLSSLVWQINGLTELFVARLSNSPQLILAGFWLLPEGGMSLW